MSGDLRDAKEPGMGRHGDTVFQEEVTASAKALRQRRNCKRKRRESCVRGAGRKVRRVRDEVQERSEESLEDLIGCFYSENHISHRGLLSRLVTRPNVDFKILQLHLVTACREIGIEAGIK